MVIATDLVESTSAGTATVEVEAAASPVHPPPLGLNALVFTVMVCAVPITESGSSGQLELAQVTIRSCPGPPHAAVTRRAEAPASVVGTGMSAAIAVDHEITGDELQPTRGRSGATPTAAGVDWRLSVTSPKMEWYWARDSSRRSREVFVVWGFAQAAGSIVTR